MKLADDAMARMRELSAQHFISKDQVQQRQADLLNQRARLQALVRNRTSIADDLAAKKDESATMPLRHQNQLAQIERDIASLGQELIESGAKRSLKSQRPRRGLPPRSRPRLDK